MHLTLTPEQAALVRRIRSFLDEHWAGNQPPADDGRRFEFLVALDDQGWSVPNWPEAHGGCGWTPQARYLLDRELAEAGAPIADPFLTDVMGPLIIEAGSTELQARCLPTIRAGRARWCSALQVEPSPVSHHQGSSIRLGKQRLLVRGAADADRLVVLVNPDGHTPTLGLVDLTGAGSAIRIHRGLPLDPDRVDVDDVLLAAIGAPGQGQQLLDAALRRASREPRAQVSRIGAKVRRLEDRVRELGDQSLEAQLQEIEIGLAALDGLEQRSVGQGDTDAIRALVRLKLRELAVEISYAAVAALGYYALPSFDPIRMGNEGRPGAERDTGTAIALDPGWDAIEELFGYVGSLEDMTDRDRIAAEVFGEGVGSGQGT